ncbi:uncharacterized protein LOC101455765 [Ceratitis capitata]|uniref:(Mediterranean fruit fly) hypothetical protein n=1 Tax=Ceratitis capitata TaxID=7213 RepID=A0A811VGM8_CERCA|nr:uncharacterized protein LOC101455765 [Ceratitis capitata]CAD7014450.1 unnamed protein product [Ceratitis capitata]
MFAQLQHTPSTTAYLLLPLVFASWLQGVHCRPSSSYTTDGTELVVVKEIVRCTRQGLHELCQNVTSGNDEEPNGGNESMMDIVDDLILLEKRPKQHQQQQRQQQRKDNHHPYEAYQQQSELLTSAAAREDSLVAAAAAAPAIGDPSDSTALGSSYQQDTFDSDSDSNADGAEGSDATNVKTTDVDAVNAAAADEIIADGVLFHGVLMRLADGPHTVPQPVPPIDMSAFVSLIPAEEVKSIATNYYNNDAEVRRAYAYLSGSDFIALRQRIVDSPEVGAFLQYLNVSGLDVLKFVSAIANLTTLDSGNARSVDKSIEVNSRSGEAEQQQQRLGANEISVGEQNVSPTSKSLSTTFTEAGTQVATTTAVEPITLQGEQLNGLHGLVDSILEILPQDQILATFFDKLESDESFRKFVNNIQRPSFAQILSKMEQSMALRNLIFTLHNNGIYITRIVDSLKAYFFLGGFS